MKDDTETLREFIHYANMTPARQQPAIAAFERVVADRDSLRKALDDRWAADIKAAKAIFAETGRTHGFPSVKEIVAYYMAEVERLEKESGGWKQLYETEKESAEAVDLDNITLRAKLERAGGELLASAEERGSGYWISSSAFEHIEGALKMIRDCDKPKVPTGIRIVARDALSELAAEKRAR
jgi:hypothetical protein